MRAAIILALIAALQIAHADDLDIIVDAQTSSQDRGLAYERLVSTAFPEIAAKLATLIGTHPVFTSGGPQTKQPWSEARLRDRDRISFTLHQLWQHHTDAIKMRGQNIGLMMTILEDSSIGEGRHLALSDLSSRLTSARARSDPSLPPSDAVVTRLDRLARDVKQPNDLRRQIVELLFEHGDPNEYLDLFLELAAAEDTPLRQSEALRFSSPAHGSPKFTESNRKKYVRHCFALLEKIDDGRSGYGYFLAMQVGGVIGIPPLRTGQGAFAPDQRLPEYQGPNGLAPSFFQDTVANARKWWNENKDHY